MTQQQPNILVCHDQHDLFRHSAQLVVDVIRESIEKRGACALALSGGSTPRALFEKISSDFATAVDWSKVMFFWSDERTVGPEHDDSNYRMAHESLLAPLGIPAEHQVRMRGEDDPQSAAADYQQRIADAFGVGTDQAPPQLDLVLLGLGADGHTASIFPHTEAVYEQQLWVMANEVPQQNTWRLTMTAPLINRARCVMFLAAGAGKRAAVREILSGQIRPDEYPAQLIGPAGELIWMLDQAAAGEVDAK